MSSAGLSLARAPQAQGFGSAPRQRQPTLDQLGAIAGVHREQVPSLTECKPGLIPTEYNVIIAPAVMPEQTSGGILLADETKDRQSGAMQIGRLISASAIAFNYDTWPEGYAPPQAGDIVWFARYAGGEFEGADGRTYRIVKDKDIGGIIPE